MTIVVLNTDEIDFVKSEGDLQRIFDLIESPHRDGIQIIET